VPDRFLAAAFFLAVVFFFLNVLAFVAVGLPPPWVAVLAWGMEVRVTAVVVTVPARVGGTVGVPAGGWWLVVVWV
jgi:hypothetical protein